MRQWKRAKAKEERVFLYFREHKNKFFTPEHVGKQVGIGRRHVRLIVGYLEAIGKLEGVDTVSSYRWGRPKRMYRACRSTDDSLAQLEIFQKAAKDAGIVVGH